MARWHRPLRAVATPLAPLRHLAVAALLCGFIAGAAAAPARAQNATAEDLAGTPAPAAQNASVPPGSSADTPAEPRAIDREYLIKAAILFNFAKFAVWPDATFRDAASPLTVCVLGVDPFGAALDTLSGKQVRSRPLAIARITAVEDAGRCQILFVSASEQPRLAAILDHVGGLPILTVADMDRFAEAGGVIGLKEVDNHSRMEVNIAAVERAGLKLSSKLLRLADTVGARAASNRP